MSRKHDIEELVEQITTLLPFEEDENLGSIEGFPALVESDEWFLDELNDELVHLGVQLEVVVDQVILRVF